MQPTQPHSTQKTLPGALGARPLVLIGLMGAGKSAIGRLVAKQLGLRFVDADAEIEQVSKQTIAELFEHYGEAEFRALERRVIARLMEEGPLVLATGGGAFMDDETRAVVLEKGVSVWLRATLDVLMERVSRKDTRPLLRVADPRAVMAELMERRYPVYAKADIVVDTGAFPKQVVVDAVIEAVGARIPDLKHNRQGKNE